MTDEELKTEIGKLIRQKKCHFRCISEIVPVNEVSNVSVTMLEKINSDNKELDNYSFSGEAMISVKINDGFIEVIHTINGTAKVTGETVQINTPVSINKK